MKELVPRWYVCWGFAFVYVCLEFISMLVGLPLEDRYPSGWAMLQHSSEIPTAVLALYVTGVFVLRFPVGTVLSLLGAPCDRWAMLSVLPNAFLAACVFHWLYRLARRARSQSEQ